MNESIRSLLESDKTLYNTDFIFYHVWCVFIFQLFWFPNCYVLIYAVFVTCCICRVSYVFGPGELWFWTAFPMCTYTSKHGCTLFDAHLKVHLLNAWIYYLILALSRAFFFLSGYKIIQHWRCFWELAYYSSVLFLWQFLQWNTKVPK